MANMSVFLLIGLNYISLMPSLSTLPLITVKGMILAYVFAVLAFVGQFSLFALAGCAIVLPLILCIPRRWFAFATAILVASALSWLLLIDSIVFHLYRFHLVGVVWQIISSGTFSQVLVFSKLEWVIATLVALVFLLLEFGLAIWVWRRLLRAKKINRGKWVALSLFASLFLSYTLYLNAAVHTPQMNATALSNNHMLIMEGRVIPYYNTVLGKLIPTANGQSVLANMDDGFFVQNKQINKPLKYPLHPLQFKTPHKKLNIVVIAIDTWRSDMMNHTVSPHIEKFAKTAWQFNNHYSGGNSTQPGIFSLFYSLPPPYWTSMLKQKRGPVFIQRLLQDHYQMGIFGSASLHFPAFDDTVFRAVKNLQVETPGNDPIARDKKITEEFKQFIAHRDSNKPFFGYLFYDAVHSFCEGDPKIAQPFQPSIKQCNRMMLGKHSDPTPYLNRYKNAVLFDDHLVGEALASLKKYHLLKNTVVIITADHGEEFNDEGLGYWGHASAYDPYQVKTPFIVYWPHTQPKVINYKTSHYDLVPTLMSRVLGCTNPASDYSVGKSLLTKGHRPYLIVGSYVDYAILQKHRITTIYQGGDYAITHPNEHSMPGAKLDMHTFQQAFQELNRYFK